jgi:cytochrome c peroxidase
LQVLDHYSSGIVQSPTLDPSLRNGIPLTFEEKFNLLEFFYTLTDSTFIKDERFAAPR